ncbi:hypothetical protein [Allohahella sp. A8]|uniref:hypothetical protein n=1 Tax=Allohahella sp. A8 TaxID=3141461 RepID=UPI003A8125B4
MRCTSRASFHRLAIRYVLPMLASVTLLTNGTVALAEQPSDKAGIVNAASSPIDFSEFDIYASEGFVLTHRYVTDDGEAIVTLDTTQPSVTREIHADATVTAYEVLESENGEIILEQVTDYDAAGACQATHKTRYRWLATFPEVASVGDQLQRIASVTDFDHERPCGTRVSNTAVESVIKVTYTVLGRTRYNRGPIKLSNCVKVSEQAPDYSGIATLCAGVGTAFRVRTGSSFGRNERRLLAIEQPAAQEARSAR